MTKLRMKCPHCSCWNPIEVDKNFVPQPSTEPKVKVLIPMHKPLKTERCEKCGKVIAEPKELIRIMERALAKAVPRLRGNAKPGREGKVPLRQPRVPSDTGVAGARLPEV